uniref:Putative secreted protein n=1 Tax=Xenopsylla cheopis TaxID=163159 RepID=A0A6M2DZZ7_XENCH
MFHAFYVLLRCPLIQLLISHSLNALLHNSRLPIASPFCSSPSLLLPLYSHPSENLRKFHFALSVLLYSTR